MSSPVCDAHVHVFDPKKYPYVTPRRFTPGVASVRQLQDHIRKLEISNVVLVQPSVYGDNNACLLNAMYEMQGVAGGVVVISRATPSSEIDEMHHLGVRGARINLVVDHQHDPEVAVRKIQEIDSIIPEAWHIQLHVGIGALGAIFDRLEGIQRVFVLDHLGLPDVSKGTQSFAWQRLLQLVGLGNLFVKLSGPYLSSLSGPPYSDLEPFVKSLLRIRPDRLLWGSNWPHTQGVARGAQADTGAIEAFRQVDDLQWLQLCSMADEQASAALFCENARRIYDFI